MAAACSLVKAAVSPLKFAQYVKIRPIFLSAAYICPFGRKYWEIVLGKVKFLKRYCYHKVCREVQIVSGKVCRKAESTRFKAKTKRRTSHPCGKTPVCEIGNRHSPNRCWATSCGPVAGRDWTRSSPQSSFARWTGCGWRATCCTWSPGSASTTCLSSDSPRCEWQGLRWKLKKLI